MMLKVDFLVKANTPSISGPVSDLAFFFMFWFISPLLGRLQSHSETNKQEKLHSKARGVESSIFIKYHSLSNIHFTDQIEL